MRQQLTCLRQRDFDAFLYSVVREIDGVPLTVLSVLARNDLDPWDAAEEFTQLSRKAAAARLAVLLSNPPNETGEPPDNLLTTMQLLGMLPDASAAHGQDVPPVWQSLVNLLARLKEVFLAERPPGRRKQ